MKKRLIFSMLAGLAFMLVIFALSYFQDITPESNIQIAELFLAGFFTALLANDTRSNSMIAGALVNDAFGVIVLTLGSLTGVKILSTGFIESHLVGSIITIALLLLLYSVLGAVSGFAGYKLGVKLGKTT